MAFTLFGDVKFDSDLFLEYMEELSPEPTAFIQSGIVRRDPAIENRLTEGNLVTVPFFKPLTGTSQNYDGSDIAVNSIGSGTQSGIVIGRANAWGTQDLAAELASRDPQMAIAMKVAKYWQEEWQRILILQLNGVFSAADFATHVYDVAIEDGNNAVDANLMGADIVIDAIQKALGDNGRKVTALSVHSKVYSRLQKLNLIDFRPLGDQGMNVPFFLDKQVIVDDAHTVTAGTTSGFKYTSYLFAQGAIGKANGKVKVPVETYREPLTNGGRESLIHRDRRVYHMYGSNFTSASLATISPTDAELGTATNYTKVYDDKNIPVIRVITNG